ncbi:MAG: DUF362 domain-containing protein [Clostridiales bacterium]|nr:DUF362 domain-containing protein [Clostridiales bacterium]
MSNVYYKENCGGNFEELGQIALELLKKIEKENDYFFDKNMPIKVHFGEKGNVTFIPALTYNPIIDYLKEKGSSPFFIETNVLYRGSRTTSTSHIKLAKEHGFTQIPVVIADGETGTEFDEIVINKEFFKKSMIGKEFSKYNKFLVTSHFKGHEMAGFGGSLKQLAMGFASRGGKLAQHSGISPVVNENNCISCGLCIEKCDFNAITMDGTAVIDSGKCIGCAGCIAVCPEGAIRNQWNATNFYEKISEYAYAAQLGKENLYVSFLVNITKECDCMGQAMTPITSDIGVFAGTDPVAMDTACLEVLQQKAGKKLFEKGRASLLHAEKIGLGTMSYNLIKVD